MAAVSAAWGDDAPEEVIALAQACVEFGTQGKAAQRIGYSNSVVSSVLNRKYKGSYPEVYARIRASFMRSSIACPVLGAINGGRCAEAQRMPPSVTGKDAQIYRACREGCPHSSLAPYPYVKRRLDAARAQERKADHVE